MNDLQKRFSLFLGLCILRLLSYIAKKLPLKYLPRDLLCLVLLLAGYTFI